MEWVELIASLLLIIGGLNWGLVGLAGFNLVEAIFGAGSALTRVVYVLVGLSALWALWHLIQESTGGMAAAPPA
jgi:uncharacterized membrane protein YuzA (DUF378 family)